MAGTPGVAVLNEEVPQDGGRINRLKTLESYYYNTQYDGLEYDWDGEKLRKGSSTTIVSERKFIPDNYEVHRPPSKFRRPNMPYAIAAVVVDRLSNLVFGEDHFPEIRVPTDDQVEEFDRAFCKQVDAADKMMTARTIGGSTGTVLALVELKKGKFCLQMLKPYCVEVTRWADESEKLVGAVRIQYKYKRQERAPDSRKLTVKEYWFRREIDEEKDMTYLPVEVRSDGEEQWEIDQNSVVKHDLGVCPAVWIQNRTPPDDDADGVCDFASTLQQIDQMNRLLSSAYQGSLLSMEPVPVLETDEEITGGIKKAGNQWILPGLNGKAYYMEPTGAGVKLGMELADKLEGYILRVCHVVLDDPDKVSGSAQSAAAMRILFQPMLAICGKLRTQYGARGLVRILKIARLIAKVTTSRAANPPAPEPQFDEAGQPIEQPAQGDIDVSSVINLPPRQEEQTQPLDPMTKEPAKQGSKCYIAPIVIPWSFESMDVEAETNLSWPPFFPSSYADHEEVATAIAGYQATKLVSDETLIEKFGTVLDIKDPKAELAKAKAEENDKQATAAANMGGMPGEVPGETQTPVSRALGGALRDAAGDTLEGTS